MMVKSFVQLDEFELVTFEQFAKYLSPEITESDMILRSWRQQAPKLYRIGHGKPRWRADEVAEWLKSQVFIPNAERRGRPKKKVVRYDLSATA